MSEGRRGGRGGRETEREGEGEREGRERERGGREGGEGEREGGREGGREYKKEGKRGAYICRGRACPDRWLGNSWNLMKSAASLDWSWAVHTCIHDVTVGYGSVSPITKPKIDYINKGHNTNQVKIDLYQSQHIDFKRCMLLYIHAPGSQMQFNTLCTR